jgi:hypothetical protein
MYTHLYDDDDDVNPEDVIRGNGLTVTTER